MKLAKHLAFTVAAFALTANPVLAADARMDAARAAAPVAQSEQLFGDEDGGGWLLWALAGIALAVGLVLVLDNPASP
jgi:hypothetical protein